jgi:hypothetical protein
MSSLKAPIFLSLCWLLFCLVAALFMFAALPIHTLFHLEGEFLSFVLPLGVVGLLLLMTASWTAMSKWLRFFFILTGASALGWPIGLYAHNLVLFRHFPNEPVTYVLVFFILPVTFIAGIIGTIVVGIRLRLK